jgi:hypothetical protein
MFGSHDDDLLRAAFAPARTLEPSPAEVARVIARGAAPRRPRRFPTSAHRGRFAATALATLLVLCAGVYAVPATRAAIESAVGSVADAFSGYQRGDTEDAPGRPLVRRDRAPEYFGDRYLGRPLARQPRVLAAAGGYRLFAYRSPSGSLGFDLGDTGVAMGFPSADAIGPGALVVLGPGAMRHADADGHVPLFGLVADSVREVELLYDSGPPLRRSGVEGGFVLLASPSRGPREVVAFDAAGRVVGRQLVDDSSHGLRIDWERY